jgi:glycosyltransferase involved in cell wall biosynthesis
MRISIVVPSLNQGPYLEETLSSVLDQGYPDVELIVIDGGSTDNSVEILRRYSKHLAFWVSEPDRGQTDAINKGLNRASGEIWSYLNSDDLLLPGALSTMTRAFKDPAVRWAGGVSDIFDRNGPRGEIRPRPVASARHYLTPWNRPDKYIFPCSNVTFYRRDVLAELGGFDESYKFCMDIEFDVRLAMKTGQAPHLIDAPLGRWRWHSDSKTMREGLWYGFREEEIRIAESYISFLPMDQQVAVAREIREQKKAVVVRRASFRRHQGRLADAAGELLRPLACFPDLLYFGPWLATALRVAMFRRGTLAR